MVEISIFDVKFTAGLEEKLDGIEEGSLNWVDTIRNFYTDFDKLYKNRYKVLKKAYNNFDSKKIYEVV